MSGGSSFKTHFLYTLYKSNQEILFAKWERGGGKGVAPCLLPNYYLTTLNY